MEYGSWPTSPETCPYEKSLCILNSLTKRMRTCKYLKSDYIRVFSNPNFSASFSSSLATLITEVFMTLHQTAVFLPFVARRKKLTESLPLFEPTLHGCVNLCVQYLCVHVFVFERSYCASWYFAN